MLARRAPPNTLAEWDADFLVAVYGVALIKIIYLLGSPFALVVACSKLNPRCIFAPVRRTVMSYYGFCGML